MAILKEDHKQSGNTATRRFESRLQFKEKQITAAVRTTQQTISHSYLITALTTSAKTAQELVSIVRKAFAADKKQIIFLRALLSDYPGMWHEVKAIYATLSTKK